MITFKISEVYIIKYISFKHQGRRISKEKFLKSKAKKKHTKKLKYWQMYRLKNYHRDALLLKNAKVKDKICNKNKFNCKFVILFLTT